jgi:acyl-CoA reductase-like NAD-dependent aldehyde dehydrogenase
MASSGSLEQLRAAVIDGRTENVRYRQNELQRLHSSLRENATTIIAAISKDAEAISPNIRFESEAEYWLAMDGVERQFESLDFEASLKQEYLITTGASNKDRRVGKGLVLIRPSTHTRFYSIIIPLATAITAGNCVALEVRFNVHMALQNKSNENP